MIFFSPTLTSRLFNLKLLGGMTQLFYDGESGFEVASTSTISDVRQFFIVYSFDFIVTDTGALNVAWLSIDNLCMPAGKTT